MRSPHHRGFVQSCALLLVINHSALFRSSAYLTITRNTVRTNFPLYCPSDKSKTSLFTARDRSKSSNDPWSDYSSSSSSSSIQNLLTQRSIQSFCHLCESVRDPHSVTWLQNFFGFPNCLEYHGVGASFVANLKGWEGPYLALLQASPSTVTIAAKRRGRGHGGWSRDNPYLEERFVEFEIEVNPVSLVGRILSVREQLATEWCSDLNVLAEATEQQIQLLRQGEPQKQVPRLANALIHQKTSSTASGSSPFRKGNFDLVYNLATQEAIHRMLQPLSEAKQQRRHTYEWLRDVYSQSAATYFDGDQPYGRGDDFVDHLLQLQQDNQELIVELLHIRRDVVVPEWKEILLRVPEDHQNGIRKQLLTKQMQLWGSSSSTAPLNDGFE